MHKADDGRLIFEPGERFGKLEVVSLSSERRHGQIMWLCKCDCGNLKLVNSSNLAKPGGGTKSCGCSRHRPAHNRTNCGELGGQYWSTVKGGARERGIEIRITIQQAWEAYAKQGGRCALSGVELLMSPKWSERSSQTASLDRIDSSRPYELDNIQWVHKDINKMKNTLNQAVFLEWCRKVAGNAA
jgi:hypothetical protein